MLGDRFFDLRNGPRSRESVTSSYKHRIERLSSWRRDHRVLVSTLRSRCLRRKRGLLDKTFVFLRAPPLWKRIELRNNWCPISHETVASARVKGKKRKAKISRMYVNKIKSRYLTYQAEYTYSRRQKKMFKHRWCIKYHNSIKVSNRIIFDKEQYEQM